MGLGSYFSDNREQFGSDPSRFELVLKATKDLRLYATSYDPYNDNSDKIVDLAGWTQQIRATNRLSDQKEWQRLDDLLDRVFQSFRNREKRQHEADFRTYETLK